MLRLTSSGFTCTGEIDWMSHTYTSGPPIRICTHHLRFNYERQYYQSSTTASTRPAFSWSLYNRDDSSCSWTHDATYVRTEAHSNAWLGEHRSIEIRSNFQLNDGVRLVLNWDHHVIDSRSDQNSSIRMENALGGTSTLINHTSSSSSMNRWVTFDIGTSAIKLYQKTGTYGSSTNAGTLRTNLLNAFTQGVAGVLSMRMRVYNDRVTIARQLHNVP